MTREDDHDFNDDPQVRGGPSSDVTPNIAAAFSLGAALFFGAVALASKNIEEPPKAQAPSQATQPHAVPQPLAPRP